MTIDSLIETSSEPMILVDEPIPTAPTSSMLATAPVGPKRFSLFIAEKPPPDLPLPFLGLFRSLEVLSRQPSCCCDCFSLLLILPAASPLLLPLLLAASLPRLAGFLFSILDKFRLTVSSQWVWLGDISRSQASKSSAWPWSVGVCI